MKGLVACECSGTVRDAFIRRGHDMTSCDILPTDAPGPHVQGDTRPLLRQDWEIVIAHPPCTYLSNSGVRWLFEQSKRPSDAATLEEYATAAAIYERLVDEGVDAAPRLPRNITSRAARRWVLLVEGAALFRDCLAANSPRVAVENPVMHKYARQLVGVDPTQFIHPWQHGHTQRKATGLWLKGLPALAPTRDVKAEMLAMPYAEGAAIHHASPGPDRGKIRSVTFLGIAEAMAAQWG